MSRWNRIGQLSVLVIACAALGGCNPSSAAWNEACSRSDRLHGLVLTRKEPIEIRRIDATRVRDANQQVSAYWSSLKTDPADGTAEQWSESRAIALKSLWLQDPGHNIRTVGYAETNGPDWNNDDENAVRALAVRRGADLVLTACVFGGTQQGVGFVPAPSFATATATNNRGGSATASGFGWTAVPVQQEFSVFNKVAIFFRHCSPEDVAAIDAARVRGKSSP